jgi:phage nucleotide-binding protein
MASSDVLTERTLGGLKVVPVQKRAPFINILVYGDSGVGKTTLAGSADDCPELRPAIVVDFEGGTESLVRTHPDIDQVRVSTWKEMQAVYDELHRGKHGYSTVILDSLTEIQKFNMYQIMEELMEKRPDLDPDVPSMREWGKNLEQMRRFVRAFRDLPMNTIFTALKKEDKNDKTGMVTTLPSLSGKLAGEVAAFLDIVAYYYVKRIGNGADAQEKRMLLTAKTETIVAKDRTRALPMVIEDQSMQKIFDMISKQPQGAKRRS